MKPQVKGGLHVLCGRNLSFILAGMRPCDMADSTVCVCADNFTRVHGLNGTGTSAAALMPLGAGAHQLGSACCWCRGPCMSGSSKGLHQDTQLQEVPSTIPHLRATGEMELVPQVPHVVTTCLGDGQKV